MGKKTLQNLLEKNAQLKQVINKVAATRKIEQLAQTELEILIASSGFSQDETKQFINAVKVVNYEKNHLYLIVENASFATHLRFLVPELNRRLQKNSNLVGLKSISFKINSSYFSSLEIPSVKCSHISQESSKLLKDILKSLK